MPLYLALAEPEVTRNLLQYRRNQLPHAQHNAREQGLAGALYPMVTFTGIECHNEWEITFEEIHRNGAIPYAIYNYTNYTGNESYLAKEGLEVLVEVSRFWADRVHFSKRNGKYMIHGVTGPNEYENNINNNWYTNTLAAWVLDYTREALAKYPRPDLNVSAAELENGRTSARICTVRMTKNSACSSNTTASSTKTSAPCPRFCPTICRSTRNGRGTKSCVRPSSNRRTSCKASTSSATVSIWTKKRRNFDFYEPMTVHESSLSPCIHAILAAELGKEEKAVEMYQRTSRLDLDNYNNDTEDGLHITSMTGSWLAIVQGFAQMKTWGGKLSFAPFLPSAWTGYAFHINYRGRLIKVAVGKENVVFTLLKGRSARFAGVRQKTSRSTAATPVALENKEGANDFYRSAL